MLCCKIVYEYDDDGSVTSAMNTRSALPFWWLDTIMGSNYTSRRHQFGYGVKRHFSTPTKKWGQGPVMGPGTCHGVKKSIEYSTPCLEVNHSTLNGNLVLVVAR